VTAAAPPPKLRKSKRNASAETRDRRYLWLTLSCVSYLLSILWKEMALTFPVLVGAYVFFFSTRDIWWRRIRDGVVRSLPFWGVTLVYVLLRVKVLGYFSRVQHEWPMTRIQFVANVVRLSAQYCWRLVWPTPLNAWYPFHPATSLAEPMVIISIVALLAITAGLWWGARRSPIAAFCGAWILITLTPVLNLQGIGENVFAERYLYIPSLGFSLLCAMAGSELLKKLGAFRSEQPPKSMVDWLRVNSAGVALVGLIATAATLQLRARTVEWRSSRSLFQSALRIAPDATTMRNNLGQELRMAGELDLASEQYEEALRLAVASNNDVQAAIAYSGLAGISWQRGDAEKALELVHEGQKINNTPGALRVSESLALVQLGRFDEAKPKLLAVLRYFPNDEIVLNALGVIAMNQRDYPAAIQYFSRAVDVLPTFAEAYNNLGQARISAGMVRDAIAPLQRSVELQPGNPRFLISYGAGLAKDGRIAEARTQFERALQIDPGNSVAAYNLQIVNRMAAAR
jgi:tetratricopeptide (TPR) repeat protein